MTEDEKSILDLVPEDGSIVTNRALQRSLAWELEKYWRVRNDLVDRGLLNVGRGRGGSVFRMTPTDEIEAITPVLANGEALSKVREEDMYPAMVTVLDREWASNKRLDQWIVHSAARQGRKDTGGRWSRPDLVLVTQSTYPFVPGKHFDVITFEVKRFDAIDVMAVYEALAHRRAATRAYVALHVPDTEKEALDATLTEVYSEAKRHGVGVITFSQPDDFDTWDEVVEPARLEPDPWRLNDFLVNQLTQDQQQKVLRWVR